jgi:hypothetical protein
MTGTIVRPAGATVQVKKFLGNGLEAISCDAALSATNN